MTTSFRVWMAVAAVAGATGAATPATAQTAFPIVARDSGASVYRVGSGVYAIVHADAVHSWPDAVVEWPHGNTGVVVGSDATLVIDSNLFPSRAADDIALIRRITDKPVRYLVNTHWHGDHTHGNATYARAFPGLTIVGATPNRHFIALNQARFVRRTLADKSAVRTTLAEYETTLARKTDSTGKALSDSSMRVLMRAIAEYKQQLREFAEVRVSPPTALFDANLVLDLGGRTVELRNWDRGNSPADVTAYVTNEKVLFTGDLVVHPVPYVFGAYPVPWISVLRSLEALPVTAVVPGHGPVFADHQYVRQVRELLEAARMRVTALMEEGKGLPEVQKTVDLSDFRPRFVAPGNASSAQYWEVSIKGGLIERTFYCVQGNNC